MALQHRIIIALFLRETRTRFGDTLLGYGWTLLEPIVNVLIWAILFQSAEKEPPLGDSKFLFVATGFFPFFLFRHLSNQLLNSITANRSLLQFPVVHNLDVIMARALLEVVTFVAVLFIYFMVFYAFGLSVWPASPLSLMMALTAIGLVGFGVGMINAVFACIVHSWSRFFAWYLRASYIASGVFFLPEQLPQWIQDILWYLPITHGIEWCRQAFYDGYESKFLSIQYLVASGAFMTFIGLALERLLRRKISVEI